MRPTTTPPNEPGTVGHDRVVEKEVETVRTRQRVARAPGDAMPAPRTVTSERTGRYLETLPERLSAVMAIVLIALEGLLGSRFLLRAYGANPSSGFVRFINDVA